MMSCLLCLMSISVFLQVNFLLKLALMVATAAAHVAFHAGFVYQMQ